MGRSRPVRSGIAVVAGLLVAGLLSAGLLSAPAAAAAGGRIEGTFTTGDGRPVAGATVIAYGEDQNWLADTVTDEGGRYLMTGVAAGALTLQFDDQGRQQWSPALLTSDAATVYDLADGGTLAVHERQPVTGTVTGRFTDAAGARSRPRG
jgi:hypothetical protein